MTFFLVGADLPKRKNGDYKAAGYKKLKDLIDAAEDEGIVQWDIPSGPNSEVVRRV